MVKAMAHRPITATPALNTRAAKVSRQNETVPKPQQWPGITHTHLLSIFKTFPFQKEWVTAV